MNKMDGLMFSARQVIAQMDPGLLQNYELRRYRELPEQHTNIYDLILYLECLTCRNPKQIMSVWLGTIVFTGFSLMIGLFSGFRTVTALSVLVGVAVLLITPIVWWRTRRQVRHWEAKAREIEPILRDFLSAAEAFEGPFGCKDIAYNEEQARGSLEFWAFRVLQAKHEFEVACEPEGRDIKRVVECGLFYLKCQEELNTALEQLRRFGLEFNKKQIFAAAAKRMER